MAEFLSMVTQYMSLVYAVIALGLTLAIYFAFRFQINFWFLNFWYSIPLVGKLARLSKDPTHSSNPGWFRAEETLCGDYRKHIMTTSEQEFRKRLEYMSKAQDLGRRPVPGWMVAVLAILLVAEGLGFSYLLGTWMAREGSANVHTMLMLAIVFVICTIMLFLTHAAGHQLYRTGLIKRIDKEWRDGGQTGPLLSREVKLDHQQSVDDDQPGFTQTANRVGTYGSYAMVWIAAFAILSIAGVSTWMRVNHLNQEMIERTAVQPSATMEGNPFSAGRLPAELVKPQQEADAQARIEALSSEKGEGLAAFIMLALIFIVTQIVGIYAGYKFGFAGKSSADAFKGTRGFAMYDDYMERVEPMIQVGQAKLQSLQRNLASLGVNVKLPLHKTFDDYIREAEGRRHSRLNVARSFTEQASPVELAKYVEPKDRVEKISDVLKLLAGMETFEEKKSFASSLPEPLKSEFIEYRKAEKKREEEKIKAQDDDLNELL